MLQKIKGFIKKILNIRKVESIYSKLTKLEAALIARIKSNNLTYLSDERLSSILMTCKSIEEANIPGDFIETGCALGGSSILIAKTKQSSRSFFVYDVFGMIPAPSQEDDKAVHDRYKVIVEGKSKGIGEDKYYGYQENLYDVVQSNLKNFGIRCEEQHVSLIKGLVQDTLSVEKPIAFAHIDVDWFDPVNTCLRRIFPHLSVGGAIILDDYNDWAGCRKATDEYLREVTGKFILDDSAGSLKITKINN